MGGEWKANKKPFLLFASHSLFSRQGTPSAAHGCDLTARLQSRVWKVSKRRAAESCTRLKALVRSKSGSAVEFLEARRVSPKANSRAEKKTMLAGGLERAFMIDD